MWCSSCLVVAFILQVVLGASIGKQNFFNTTNNNNGGDSILTDEERITFITSGWYASRLQFPYMVAIQRIEEAISSIFPCGGSLISQNYVLTAAHCIAGSYNSKVYVKLGAYDLSQLSEYGRYTTEIPLVNLILHERYDSQTYINDIALIRLPVPIMLTSYIQLVSLPPPSSAIDDSYYEARDGMVSGWGTFSTETTQTSPILKYTFTDVIDSDTCNTYYSNYFNYLLSYGQFCAISFPDGGHPCAGDSGGPLIDRYTYPPVQIGVVSLGGKTCNKYIPTIYTRVTEYLSWIGENSDVQILSL